VSRTASLASVAVVAVLGWLYFPPVGTTIELPALEAFLEPPARHAKPVFIETADHVYYRVRLKEVVAPTFGSAYFRQLLERGVQFKEETTSPERPWQRRTGWKVAMARETAKKPYTIEYWTARDRSTGRPVQLRWPWLYVRLGRGILSSKTAVLVPDQDAVFVSPDVPRYPGSYLRGASRTHELVQLRFVADATREEILSYYAAHFGAERTANDYSAWFNLPEEAAVELSHPDNVHIEVPSVLYGDDPLVVYSADAAHSLSRDMYPKQPCLLADLPRASLYVLHLRYRTEGEARRAFEGIPSMP
jgi:hypothetical protein